MVVGKDGHVVYLESDDMGEGGVDPEYCIDSEDSVLWEGGDW